MEARKTLSFREGVPWVKQSDNEDFDVLPCSYDGAKVGKLVGAFLLNNLSVGIGKGSVDLCRGDGVGVFNSHLGPEAKRKRKEIIKKLVNNNCYKHPSRKLF